MSSVKVQINVKFQSSDDKIDILTLKQFDIPLVFGL
jgi:hypothetical protein